jgi:hypothetical protein
VRKQVELATDTISDLQNQLLHLKADARGETMLMRTTLYERSKRMLTILKQYFVFIFMAYLNHHPHHISTLGTTKEQTEELMGVMYQDAVDENELHGRRHGFTLTPPNVLKSFGSSSPESQKSRGGGMLSPELRAFNELKIFLNLD